MKKLIILFILTYSWTLMAQKPLFSIGLTYQPTFYWSYNKSDWNNMPRSFPAGPRGFNGQAIGLEVEKKISKQYNLKAEIVYADQVQKIIYSTVRGGDGVDSWRVIHTYNGRYSTRYKYLKIPIMMSRYKRIKKVKHLFLSGYLGSQISVLFDYKILDKEYNFNSSVGFPIEIDFNNLLADRYFIPYEYHGKNINNLDPTDISYQDFDTDFLFSRYVLGLVGGLGLKKVFKEHYYIDISSRFEFDMTNSETKAFTYGAKKNRGVTHNIRIGFSISAGYIFSVQKEKMKKRKN